MNWPQLRYRVRIGGMPWVAKTALGVIREKLVPAQAARLEADPLTVGAGSSDASSILYIHSGWAIETVGRLWFTDQAIARVTFIRASDPALTAELMAKHDLVWYGYSSLFKSHPCDPSKAILAVHDPAELFPERPDWKTSCSIGEERIAHLRSVRAVVVISEEMRELLQSAGVNALRLPTRSQIPTRPASELADPVPLAMLGVGRIYRRKNFEQFQRIARSARRLGYRTYLRAIISRFRMPITSPCWTAIRSMSAPPFRKAARSLSWTPCSAAPSSSARRWGRLWKSSNTAKTASSAARTRNSRRFWKRSPAIPRN
jgi:hypothetical protein